MNEPNKPPERPKPNLTFRQLAYRQREGEIATSVFMWFILLLILGSVLGVWIKYFWLYWVFESCWGGG